MRQFNLDANEFSSVTSNALSFPTEQAERQKERRKAGIAVQKRKQCVEQHADDMGEDLSSIQITADEVSCHLTERNLDLIASDVEHAFFDFLCSQNFNGESNGITASECLEALEHDVESFLTANSQICYIG